MNDFHKEVLNIENSKTSIQSCAGEWNLPLGDVFFGVPESEYFGWRNFEKIPPNTTGFNFYLGANCESLIATFIKSEYVNIVQRLSIGDSSFRFGSGRNYEAITRLLSEADFPALIKFELGVWQLFSNSSCGYGKIGNVTKLLPRMPKIEHLGLYGAFHLDTIVTFPKLKHLILKLDDDIFINGGYITQKTLDNILSSNFPDLIQLTIDLDCEDNDQEYTFAKKFISGVNAPNIRKIEITGGYKHGEIDRIMKSPLGRLTGIDIQYDDGTC